MPMIGKILLVDDEPHVRRYLAMLAKTTLGQVEILEAADGREALALYPVHRPDLVLLDINMVDSNGLETLQALRTLDPRAVVVMLTAVNVRHTVDEAEALGAAGYLLKELPFEEMGRELSALVENVFGREDSQAGPGPSA